MTPLKLRRFTLWVLETWRSFGENPFLTTRMVAWLSWTFSSTVACLDTFISQRNSPGSSDLGSLHFLYNKHVICMYYILHIPFDWTWSNVYLHRHEFETTRSYHDLTSRWRVRLILVIQAAWSRPVKPRMSKMQKYDEHNNFSAFTGSKGQMLIPNRNIWFKDFGFAGCNESALPKIPVVVRYQLNSPQAGHLARKGPFTPATARSYRLEARACPKDIQIQRNTQRNIHLHFPPNRLLLSNTT